MSNKKGPIGIPDNSSCKQRKPKKKQKVSEKETDTFVGYVLNYGITSLRVFSVLKNKNELKEIETITYPISNVEDVKYLPSIIEKTKSVLENIMKGDREKIFIKAFADYEFSELFEDKQISDFTQEFYKQTHLCFNIISQKQAKENLNALFHHIADNTVIIDIGTLGVDVLLNSNGLLTMYSIPIKLEMVKEHIIKCGIPEEWTEENIKTLKSFIKGHFPPDFSEIEANNAIIIKGEYTFMTEQGYRLRRINGANIGIKFLDYMKYNREKLFCIDYKSEVEKLEKNPAEKSKIYGFKLGHIVIETILESLKIKYVFPDDKLSIHGSVNAYIFNVVIGGSANEENKKYMIQAHKLLEKMGVKVLSPILHNNDLQKHSLETDYEHACAIRECDLFFVSNKNGYFGEYTKQQIYGAFLLKKPIAFWVEPKEEELKELRFIPHEEWQKYMRVLEQTNVDNKGE